MNDIVEKRREKLKDAIKKAAKELLGFGGIPIAGFSFPLDDARTMWVIVRPATDEEATAELMKRSPTG